MNLVIPGRGASPASPEPKNTGKINQWLGLYAWVPGPTLTGRPGMTRGFFSSLLALSECEALSRSGGVCGRGRDGGRDFGA
jgi:hypothetical protein